MLESNEDCLKLALDSWAQAAKPHLGSSLHRYMGGGGGAGFCSWVPSSGYVWNSEEV